MCISFGNPSEPCCEPDAPPRLGYITRRFRPTILAEDSTGFSTHQWDTGENGILQSEVAPSLGFSAANNQVCFFHHMVNENATQNRVIHIMQPIRWVMESPDADGGTYDRWESLELFDGYDSTQFQHIAAGAAAQPITDKLIPPSSHCQFVDGVMTINLNNLIQPQECEFSDTLATWKETLFHAIAPDVLVGGDVPPILERLRLTPLQSIYAYRIVRNSVPVRPAALWHDVSAEERAAQDRTISGVQPDDEIAVDVWYRFAIDMQFREWTTEPWLSLVIDEYGLTTDPEDAEELDNVLNALTVTTSLWTVPRKKCFYLPVERATDGSRLIAASWIGQFTNCNFNRFCNPEKHSFQFQLRGHSGWSLESANTVKASQVTTSGAAWIGSESGFCSILQLLWDREIADLLFYPGEALRELYPDLPDALLYRPRNLSTDDHYLKTTTSTDYGLIWHAATGAFHQKNVTTFYLVPWSRGPLATGSTIEQADRAAGVPLSITVKRIRK